MSETSLTRVPPPPKRGLRPGCLIAVLVAVVLIGVGGYFLYQMGVDLMAETVQQELGGHPVVEQHLGGIETCELELETSDTPGQEDWFVFRVRGPKGQGAIHARIDPGGEGGWVQEAVLVTEDGTIHELPPLAEAD